MASRMVSVLVLATYLVCAAEAWECEGADCDAQTAGSDSVILLQAAGVAESVIKAGQEHAAHEETKQHGTPVVEITEAKQSPEEHAAMDFRAAFAEYIAMTLFVVIGCGSAMGVAKEPGWILQVSLTFGLAISSLAYAIGHYSGGQINCAVTFALVVTGHLSIVQGILNFTAQLLGAVTGALILTQMCPEDEDKTGGLACNLVPEGRTLNAFVGEAAMTFLLVFVVFETAVNPSAKANKELAALAIGFAVFLAHCVLIPLDGCSINPTRSMGPAFVRQFFYKNKGSFQDMWVFWLAPLLGAVGAAVVSTMMM